VLNCYIHDCGVQYEDSIGVFVGYTTGTVIAHNEIANLPYTGVSVGWGWGEADKGGGAYQMPVLYETPTTSRNNRIECNHIHNVMRARNDGGGIYTLGNQPGTIIRGNHVHDNLPAASDPGNYGTPGGIYLDEGSGFIEITGNCVYNVRTPMNYNNLAQNRKATCSEHENAFNIQPGEPGFPNDVVHNAGLLPEFRDLLKR
jgi:hypothetical protein